MKFLLSLSPFARVVAALVLGVLTGLFVGEPAGEVLLPMNELCVDLF